MEDPKATEFKISTFFELTPDLICIASKEGYFKKINRSVIDKLGFSEEELFSKPIVSFIYPDDKELTRQGKGFINDDQTQTDGLISIRERAASINGQLIIQTKPGKGTSVCVTITKSL